MNSQTSLLPRVAASPPNSSGRTTRKRAAANAAPMSSYPAYAKPQPNPRPALETSMPRATAGLNAPPEIPPAAYPPAMITNPMARPKNWLPAFFAAVATFRTTKQSMKVYRTSARLASHQPKPACGSRLKTLKNKAQHESVQNFCETGLPPAKASLRLQVENLEEQSAIAKTCTNSCNDLDNAVDAHILPIQLATETKRH